MNLLITGVWSGGKMHLAELEKMGHSVVFLQWEKDALPCPYDWVEGVVCNGLFLSHPIEKFPNLRYIQLTSAGFDRVPMDYVKKRHIEIHNARGVYSIPMAEFALSGVLALMKQLPFFRENQKAHRWEKHRGLIELSEKTVCIVGCGSVGSECAKRFSAFGCRVMGIVTAERQQPWFEAVYGTEQLDAQLSQADIVVLTLPLTERTRYLLNEERFAAMKQGAILVNIARGAVVDTAAMVEALLSGKLGGAVLDVFEEEPLLEDSPLWEMENVILTPHNSFVGEGNEKRLADLITQNLQEENR